MYTTNIIESVNSKFRKATAGRRVFPTEESLLKCLYMAAMKLERKWTKIKGLATYLQPDSDFI